MLVVGLELAVVVGLEVVVVVVVVVVVCEVGVDTGAPVYADRSCII